MVRHTAPEEWRKMPGQPRIESTRAGKIKRDGELTSAATVLRKSRQCIVARTWLGPRPRGRFVFRKSGKSNAANNLYYATNSEIATATAKPRRGQRHGNHKLTDAAVRHIRQSTESDAALARIYGVYRQTIWAARHQLWRHIR